MHLCLCGIYSLWKGRVSSTFTLTMITHCSKWREMGKHIAGRYYLVPRFRECFPDTVVIELWSKGYVRLHWAGVMLFQAKGAACAKSLKVEWPHYFQGMERDVKHAINKTKVIGVLNEVKGEGSCQTMQGQRKIQITEEWFGHVCMF